VITLEMGVVAEEGCKGQGGGVSVGGGGSYGKWIDGLQVAVWWIPQAAVW
jgi:hypothetical protein